MVRPDKGLRDAVDGAMERLRADGTVGRIYGRYGVTLQSPK
jgi:polar amino acid transport system substrate-binding protein